MSEQTKITSFFGKRKRFVGDEAALKSKKILLDDSSLKFDNNQRKIYVRECFANTVIGNDENTVEIKQNEVKDTEFLEVVTENELTTEKVHDFRNEINIKNIDKPTISSIPVPFVLMGNLSPTKKNISRNTKTKIEINDLMQEKSEKILKSPEKKSVSLVQLKEPNKPELDTVGIQDAADDLIKSAKELINKIKRTQKKVEIEEQCNKNKKELSLKEVKDKLKHSSKLNELKKSINKINEHAAILSELERKKENSVPKLSKFKAIEVDVPLSPQKNALYSPSKIERSPAKPAYERFNFLIEANSALPLPFSFQKLYELFRAVDTISSMMINRGEDIRFDKLKPAVQEMTRKTFTLRHLGQIAAVLPGAFTFHQEKVRNFGATSKTDRYELVITPTFPDSNENRSLVTTGRDDIFNISDRMSMTPRLLKARREAFYNALLEKTKDCHEEFLRSLDPPMEINRSDLKRWHPNFMVDHVPDIVPKEIPQPPNVDRPATAKEVLERAKDFLSSNYRLQKALESASQSSEESRNITSTVSPEIKEKVDSRISNPLKGISKSLLEKVRARQAAKALDSMRMTPQQEKETVMYIRLPSIARIVRTLFVNEQRGVLSWETALEKIQFSYNRNLSKNEIESHIKLLIELLPEWLSVVHIRNGNYLKMNPAVDLTSVMGKLDKIVVEKAKNT